MSKESTYESATPIDEAKGSRLAYAMSSVFTGTLGTMDSYLAIRDHSPLGALTSAGIFYITAELANSAAGRKPLCLRAARYIERKIRNRLS